MGNRRLERRCRPKHWSPAGSRNAFGWIAKLRTKFKHWQVELVTHALQHTAEDYRVDAHQRLHNVVYQTERSDLMALHALRLLAKAKKGNASVYFLPDDLHDRLTKLAK
ncbi:MAG: hypothetical protein IPJ25_15810 [Rhodocyclaceae bacterium]|nr:hypothetical protein [Rhodocyclaceae bacterium]